MRLLVVLVCLASCSSASAPGEDKPSASSRPSRVAPMRPPLAGRLVVVWSNVQQTEGCFFFSGPIGRDDRLIGDVVADAAENDGDDVRIRIGTATFEGGYHDGGLVLVRKSTHDFDGPWQVTETIRLRVHEGAMQGEYNYEECDVGDACPGRCTITADIAFSRGL